MFALVDGNNFFASCERVFRPDLRRAPVAVLSNNDGCIIARSQEVKDLGIRMGEPYFKVKQLLQQHRVHVFSSNFELYGDMSARMMNTLRNFSPDVEVYSIDECFLGLHGIAEENLVAYGHEIRNTVLQWTTLPVGVGIAPTKTLAKVANTFAKKQQGVFLLNTPELIEKALATLPVGEIWGIGRRYARFLTDYGITTAGQLCQQPDSWIRKHMSIIGLRMVHELRGISCLPIDDAPTPKKAIAYTRSFSRPITQWADMSEAISLYITKAAEKLREQNMMAKHMQVFLHTSRYADNYYSNAMQRQLPQYTSFTPELILHGRTMLQRIFHTGFRYTKCGVILSDFAPAAPDLGADLFHTPDYSRQNQLMGLLDSINHKHGKHTLFYAGAGTRRTWSMSRCILSPSYTSKWEDLPKVRA